MNINGALNKVQAKTEISVNGASFSGINGIRQYGYDKWRMGWNGNHFAPPDVGSVLYLPGVPGFGSTIFDFSGQGNDGTITGAIWRQRPTGLWYLDFDGADDRVVVSHHASLMPTDKVTVECWVYSDAWDADHGGVQKAVLTVNGYGLSFKTATRFYAGTNQANGAALSTGVWHYVVGTYDKALGSNNIKVYGDLVLIDGTTDTGGIVGNTEDLKLGEYNNEYQKLKLALVRVYSEVVLTTAQMSNHYSQERHLFGV